jgi:hypothetical protein
LSQIKWVTIPYFQDSLKSSYSTLHLLRMHKPMAVATHYSFRLLPPFNAAELKGAQISWPFKGSFPPPRATSHDQCLPILRLSLGDHEQLSDARAPGCCSPQLANYFLNVHIPSINVGFLDECPWDEDVNNQTKFDKEKLTLFIPLLVIKTGLRNVLTVWCTARGFLGCFQVDGFQCRPSIWVYSSEITSRLVAVGGCVRRFPAL